MSTRGWQKRQTKPVLSITGKIDDQFGVRFAVGYATSKGTKGSCTKLEPLAGLWVNRSEKMYYDVVRGDGGQAVELPISEIPQANATGSRTQYHIPSVQPRRTPMAMRR